MDLFTINEFEIVAFKEIDITANLEFKKIRGSKCSKRGDKKSLAIHSVRIDRSLEAKDYITTPTTNSNKQTVYKRLLGNIIDEKYDFEFTCMQCCRKDRKTWEVSKFTTAGNKENIGWVNAIYGYNKTDQFVVSPEGQILGVYRAAH